MNVLFFAELYPIRENPLEYYEVAKRFSSRINDYKYNSRIVCNDDIFSRLYAEGRVARAQRVPLSSDIKQWIDDNTSAWDEVSIEKWIKYLTNHEEVLSTYLSHIKKYIFDFDILVLWGKNDTISALASQLQFKVIYMELTPSRKPYFDGIFVSQDGVNGDFKAAKEKKLNLLKNELPETKESLLIVLQLYDDLNFQLYSPFNTLNDFITDVINSFPVEYFDISIKRHPHSSIRDINLIKEDNAIKYAAELGIQEYKAKDGYYIEDFDNIVTINSSVGFEAATRGKKVFILGEASYAHDILSYSNSIGKKDNVTSDAIKNSASTFAKSYFLKWDEFNSYIMTEFCKAAHIKDINPLANHLSIIITMPIVINKSSVSISNYALDTDICYEVNEISGYVHFTEKNHCYDKPLFLLEVVNSTIVSGMTCNDFVHSYKVVSKSESKKDFILIGNSLKVIGISEA
ncbi:capsular biosynthesis protein [Pseudoalteromonas sp. 2CM28B]|uniref:capsular biosynthesis protein n=1 Tax=Pseudoalteromonas sp. 2CM28B TaxID=2929851 RepID=UPI0020BEC639|nr:capsular biosynthesis protein [Pseudoalteromonas sp. 2CM28B]MCK8137768.1 capsular biosynthesis protein [Pseudoalteromonas sp. 2CM28B]